MDIIDKKINIKLELSKAEMKKSKELLKAIYENKLNKLQKNKN